MQFWILFIITILLLIRIEYLYRKIFILEQNVKSLVVLSNINFGEINKRVSELEQSNE